MNPTQRTTSILRRLVAVAVLGLVIAACDSSSGDEPQGRVAATAQVNIPNQAPDAPKPITHGDDPPPPPSRTVAGSLAPEVSWPCEGDGTTGRRVQFIYAHGRGLTLTAGLRTTFESIARQVEGTFHTSAAKTGGERLLRYVTGAGCSLSILDVQVTDNALASFDVLISELQQAGYTQSTRIYHSWVDGGAFCGIGTVFATDDPNPATNPNNTAAQYSRSDRGPNGDCWNYAEAHEIEHNLGGVQNSAPNSTGALHSRDEYDVMSYADGGPNGNLIQPYPCPDPAAEDQLDCGNQDYFNTAPAAGSYLATHWNTATNAALAQQAGSTSSTTTPPPTSSTTLPPTTSTTTGQGVTKTTLSVPSSVYANQPFNATVTVTGACGPQGTVAYKVGGSTGNVVTVQPLSNGTATATLTLSGSVARPTIYVEYSGSAVCAKSSASARVRVR